MSATPKTDVAVELARPLGADPMPPAREYVPAEFARELERKFDELRSKVEHQAERIRYLEGATNHATGTPLSKAQAELAALRLGLEGAQMSLDNWIAASASHAVRVGELVRENAALREDAARLDWFEDWGYEYVGLLERGWGIGLPQNQKGNTRNLRAAIDAARKEAQP